MTLEDHLKTFVSALKAPPKLCLGLSGGMDSQVLLKVAVSLIPLSQLRAVHIHHGLNPKADAWSEFCRQSCLALGVAYESIRVEVKAETNLEEAARKARYTALAEVLLPGEILLTAHHQRDQAETLLLQLLRGAGPDGLSAMPALKSLGQGFLGRPFLQVSHQNLRAYAQAQGLKWIEDEMNRDPRFARSYLRNKLEPLLQAYWPGWAATLGRSADHCRQAQALIEESMAESLPAILGAQPRTLSVKALLALSELKRPALLRYWFKTLKVKVPNAAKLQQIPHDLLAAGPDRQPLLTWGSYELRRFGDELYLLKAAPAPDRSFSCLWQPEQPCHIPALGSLKATLVAAGDLALAKPQVPLEVRFRRGGESYALSSGQHHELKKFFQEAKVPPWQRESLPLLYLEGELACVPGYLVVGKFRAKPGSQGLRIDFEPEYI